MMSIEMIGGVYCPLSPHDPKHRLHSLVEQTQSRLVLVHPSTKSKFNDHIVSLNVDSIFHINNTLNNIDLNQLSNVEISLNSIAYIIFTSGTTGTPKAVSIKANANVEY
jgi:non-ribosomal peptide synthetase component F